MKHQKGKSYSPSFCISFWDPSEYFAFTSGKKAALLHEF